MIIKLSGIAHHLDTGLIMLDVHGVGYEVHVTLATDNFIRELELNQLALWIHTYVREDNIQLFGFREFIDKKWFQELIKLHGIGTKMALAIMSTYNLSEFRQAVMEGSTALLVKIPGVGIKKANKLIVDISDKLPRLTMQENSHVTVTADSVETIAQAALENLGFKLKDAKLKIKKIYKSGMSAEQIVKSVLKNS